MKKYPRPLVSLFTASLLALTCHAGVARADHGGPGRGMATGLVGTEEVPSDYVLPELADVGVTEHLGEQVPMEILLRDEQGQDVPLQQFFRTGKPVALNFVYHSCPTLCSMVQSGFTASLKEVPWNVGEQYEVLTISIDPKDTPQIAAEKKAQWVGTYGRSSEKTAAGWHFLTGDERQVKRLAQAVGFTYHYDPRQRQYAHSAAVFVLTPTGKIARYLYGIEFPGKDMRLALTEAAEGRFVSTIDHLLLYCYQYDPNARGYVLVAWRVMRLGGAVTLLLVGALLGVLWQRERRKRSVEQGAADAALPTSTDSTDLEPKLQG